MKKGEKWNGKSFLGVEIGEDLRFFYFFIFLSL